MYSVREGTPVYSPGSFVADIQTQYSNSFHINAWYELFLWTGSYAYENTLGEGVESSVKSKQLAKQISHSQVHSNGGTFGERLVRKKKAPIMDYG
jgi:hypothetical protein